eukprot:CAMPEP_0196590072 /NCGR_PEP_ID=MMETSP1081-20130531/65461_1 /TAXON_ID=36882 /ORGANISM="Pyramimonas amylifera, Strain CCMP720" /LENGTH=518 /DNA_ID=CAMNT_0041913055 /DNA_START=52 /DNA_END=1605 /DNA_ORIENTATION=+
MPPKKEPKAEGKKAPEENEPDEEEKEILERELVIGHLRNRLGKYVDRTTHLTGEYTRLSDELETQKINLKDINEFLTNELKAKETYCVDLERRGQELEQLLEQERLNAENERKKAATESQEREAALKKEIEEYETKFKELEQFQTEKESLQNSLADLASTLERERHENEERISDLERKAVQEKDRLKKEMALKIKETKANMMKLTDNQLETTTKRTIMENEQMSSELAYQSRQTEKLLHKNVSLVDETATLKRSLELSKQTEGELAKRNHVYQKTIKTLLAKLKQQDVAKRDEEDELARQLDYRRDLQDRLRGTEEELQHRSEEVEQVSRLMFKSQQEVEQVQAQQDEVAKFLITCLQDVKQQIITVVREQMDDESEAEITVLPGRLEELSLEQRERAICYLLEKLHAFQSSKQQRLLGLHRGGGADTGLVLPPISTTFPKSPDNYQMGQFGAGQMYSKGRDWIPSAMMNSVGIQTVDAALVPEAIRMGLKSDVTNPHAPGHNGTPPTSQVLQDLRTW